MDLTAQTTTYGPVRLTTYTNYNGKVAVCWRDENGQRVSLFYKDAAEAQTFLRINK